MNFDRPHRRWNPLTDEWVLVSPHRAIRPWLGQVEKIVQPELPHYDPTCYLCPGNTRAGGRFTNPDYRNTFVFDNDFAALLPPQNEMNHALDDALFQAQEENGICRVICFSPRHDLSFPELSLEEATNVIRTWRDETENLAGQEFIQYVQVFENKGALMGCSNPHPHSQIWATERIPNEPLKELKTQTAYFQKFGRTLLADYLKRELEINLRIVAQNYSFVALVPYWAVWPFEILVISRRPVAALTELDEKEISDQAEILQQVTTKYDNLFEISFPYSMGFHQQPFDNLAHPEWHLHCHFYPPLLRSATVRKFMVGFEMLGMPQRDITPEAAAERLRGTSFTHYRNNLK